MHPSAMMAGRAFFQRYCTTSGLRILDVGSMDVRGSLRSAAPEGAHYVGVDLAPGKGVDVVLADPDHFPFEDRSFDAIVSTSCFEHAEFFWLTVLECARVLAHGGYLYLNAPSNGMYHPAPTDNWRFYPDAGRAMTRWSTRNGLPMELVESFILNQIDDYWNDFVGVLRRRIEGGGELPPPPDPMYSEFPEAKNVRAFGQPRLLRLEPLPEDQRLRGLRYHPRRGWSRAEGETPPSKP